MAKVAFLGTGMLGSGMVEGMLRHGDSVTVWNRTESKARALVALGATAALAVGPCSSLQAQVAPTENPDQLAMLKDANPHLARNKKFVFGRTFPYDFVKYTKSMSDSDLTECRRRPEFQRFCCCD